MEEVYQALVAVEPTTLIVTILNLLLQIYLVKRFFWNKVKAILEKRRTMVDEELEQAKQAHRQADAMRQSYEDDRARLKAGASQILEKANRQATVRGEEIIREAEEQAEKIRDKASADAVREKEKVIVEAKNDISQLALAIAEKVLGKTLDGVEQARLVDRFIDELGDDL